MTTIEKIILRYYNPTRRNYNPKNWERCGNDIQNMIRLKSDEIRAKNLQYTEECRKIDEVTKRIENEYEAFFSLRNYCGIVAGYDWINGNDKLKKLIEAN